MDLVRQVNELLLKGQALFMGLSMDFECFAGRSLLVPPHAPTWQRCCRYRNDRGSSSWLLQLCRNMRCSSIIGWVHGSLCDGQVSNRCHFSCFESFGSCSAQTRRVACRCSYCMGFAAPCLSHLICRYLLP